MKPKHQRLVFVSVSVAFLCLAVILALQAFRDNVIFFYSPSELPLHVIGADQKIRIGGLVEKKSVVHEGTAVRFRITDGKANAVVTYDGMLPGLFREGQGVVAEGFLRNGTFEATSVLTKHDEFYMPRDVIDALKKNGQWKGPQ
jgi:cytochrome c-type biogenesis protein CcmE